VREKHCTMAYKFERTGIHGTELGHQQQFIGFRIKKSCYE